MKRSDTIMPLDRQGQGHATPYTPLCVSTCNRDRIWDMTCDLHECVISRSGGAETIGYMMDRLHSLSQRHKGDWRTSDWRGVSSVGVFQSG